MKKIIFLILSVFICIQSAAFAEKIEKLHKITDEKTVEYLKEEFKRYKDTEKDEFYIAQSISSKLLKMQKEHISDYFEPFIKTYYTVSEYENEMNFTVVGIEQGQRRHRFTNYRDTEKDKNEAFAAMRNGFLETIENVEEAYPLCVITPSYKVLETVLWVKYKDGNEKIFVDIKGKNGKFAFKAYTDREYVQSFIIPNVINYETQSFVPFSDYSDAKLNLLKKMGIISGFENNIFKPKSTLTRAEAVKLMVLMQGYNFADLNSYEPIYSDVEKDHWAAGLITACANSIQIINGFEDGTFRPEEMVTEMQFAKMLVVLLGWNNKAIVNGGYPEGYKKIAKELKIAEDIEDIPLSRDKASLMLCNTLSVNVNMVVGWDSSGEAISVVMEKGPEFMTTMWNIRKIEGTMEIHENIAIIDNLTCFIGFDDASQFTELGMTHYIMTNSEGYDVWIAAE